MIRKTLIFAVLGLSSALPLAATATDSAPEKHASAAHKTGAYISDSALTAKVKAKLLAEKNLKSLPISVESTDGVVTLSGHVISTAQIDHAVDVARHVKGVKDVHNALELKPESEQSSEKSSPAPEKTASARPAPARRPPASEAHQVPR